MPTLGGGPHSPFGNGRCLARAGRLCGSLVPRPGPADLARMALVSDQRLRELERKWRETGSVEDEAAYLRERVRVGDLTQERLELAAYCGHEGAGRATGAAGESHWYQRLDRVRGAPTLAALTAARFEIERHREKPTPVFDHPARLLAALESWVDRPTETSRLAVLDILGSAAFFDWPWGQAVFAASHLAVPASAQKAAALAIVALPSEDQTRVRDEVIAWVLRHDDHLGL